MAKPHEAIRAIGQENELHRHLVGEAEEISSVGTGRLETDGIAPFQRRSHGVRRWREEPELRIALRVVVEAAGQLPNGANPLVAGECERYGSGCRDRGRRRREDPARSVLTMRSSAWLSADVACLPILKLKISVFVSKQAQSHF